MLTSLVLSTDFHLVKKAVSTASVAAQIKLACTNVQQASRARASRSAISSNDCLTSAFDGVGDLCVGDDVDEFYENKIKNIKQN